MAQQGRGSMKQRWYDHDPTLSMAVSLLQNAPHSQQEMAARYMLRYMEREGILEDMDLSRQKVHFMFPFAKRSRLQPHAFRFLEIVKRMPRNAQLELALHLINYIYMLDAGEHHEYGEVNPGVVPLHPESTGS